MTTVTLPVPLVALMIVVLVFLALTRVLDAGALRRCHCRPPRERRRRGRP